MRWPRLPRPFMRRPETGRRPRLVDACLLFNEVDLLEIRIGELWDAVDLFVVVESNRSFAGVPKPYFLDAHWERFRRFASKMVYSKLAAGPSINRTTEDRFRAEAAQRNSLSKALAGCELHDDDIVILSDVDEIPRARLLSDLPERLCDRAYCVFVLDNCRGYLNNSSTAALNRQPFAGPVACRWGRFRRVGAQAVRRGANRAGHVLERRDRHWSYVERGGWHFSSLGGMDAVTVKASNFSHVEDPYQVARPPPQRVPIQVFNAAIGREECVLSQKRYLEGAVEPRFLPMTFKEFRIDGDLPGYLIANKERFRRYFYFTDLVRPAKDTEIPRGDSPTTECSRGS